MVLKNISLLLFIIVCGNLVSAQKYLSKEMPEISKEWHENTFTSSKSFTENIVEVPEFTILSKILKDDPLAEAIEKNEMVTIFAFSDAAFSKFGKKQKDSLLGNKKLMVSVVKYLTIPGRIDKHGLETEAKKRDGKFYLRTVNGQNLGVIENEGQLFLVGSQGRQAAITETDFYHKDGFFHIVDGLVFPDTKE